MFLILGRTIYGFGCGVLSIIGPRFIEETVPDKLLSTCSPMFIMTAAFGGFISMLLATALPDDNDVKLGEDTSFILVLGAPLPF